MYLVDTSVWIDYLRERNNLAVQKLMEILNNNIPFGITGLIYQEILQGAASIADFNKLADYFSTHHFFQASNPITSYEAAAKLYFDCRRKGLTIRSIVDCSIAQIAIEEELILLHHDKDYLNIRYINSKLKLFPSASMIKE